MAKNSKTLEIQENIEEILEDIGTMTHKFYASVKNGKFTGKLNEDLVLKLKFHLGYAKNYSDLAKTRLSYNRSMQIFPLDDEKPK